MRVAVVVVSILVIATSSYASDSCMTKSEAQKHFATTYLYWHGVDHCWDASSGRRQLTRNVQQKNTESIRKQDSESDWRGARSELLLSDTPPPAPQAQPSERNEPPSESSIGVPWTDRWVDLAQAPGFDLQRSAFIRSLKATAPSRGPAIAVGGVIIILLSGVIMVAVIEFLRRSVSL